MPEQPPQDRFIWIFLEQHKFEAALVQIQRAALKLCGSALLDLHCKDLATPTYPSHYDSTSIYDLIIFRRLATQAETQLEDAQEKATSDPHGQSSAAKKSANAGPPLTTSAPKRSALQCLTGA